MKIFFTLFKVICNNISNQLHQMTRTSQLPNEIQREIRVFVSKVTIIFD